MKKLGAYKPSTDRTPKYTVKDVAKMMGLSTYAVRYYENSGLIPFVGRSEGNIRKFSDYSVSWLRLVHCLRSTGLPVNEVKRYVEMCLAGDSTIPERAKIIFQQEDRLRQQIDELNEQMEVLKYKKSHYEELLKTHGSDICNPMFQAKKDEPDIVPGKVEPAKR